MASQLLLQSHPSNNILHLATYAVAQNIIMRTSTHALPATHN
jgi:hypothetical protein